MAYREIEMWEVLEVLRRIHRGEKQRPMARVTGIARTTIRRYEQVARELGWVPELFEPDEALALAVTRQLRPSTKEPKPGAAEALLLPHRERIKQWLALEDEKRGLRLTKVHQLLVRQGVVVPYSSLHRFAQKHCGFGDARRMTVRIADVAPGELAEVDFGRLGLVWDPVAEKHRVHHALIVTLVHSRHQYIHICIRQKLGDVIEGLEAAWQFFGGVPARVVFDNMKTAVIKADRYEPIFQRTFNEYAQYRGFVIDAAVAAHPTGKPHVERAVPYVRENFFRGETWIDREHVQREANRWCLETAGQRIHGTTRKQPLVVFENVEQKALKPLVRPPYDPPTWAECKVHPDHHICFGKALYSVPTRHIGKQVTVRGDTKLVRIYVGGEVIKTHERVPAGGRSTDYADYPKELAAYAMRDPDRMIREAKQQGESMGRFMERLLAGDFPWAKLRQAQKLLRLSNKYGAKRLDAACRRALHFELFNVKRVEQIVKNDLAAQVTPVPRGQLVMFPARFLRNAESFSHTKNPKENDHANQPLAHDRDETTQTLGPVGDPSGSRGLCEKDKTQ